MGKPIKQSQPGGRREHMPNEGDVKLFSFLCFRSMYLMQLNSKGLLQH